MIVNTEKLFFQTFQINPKVVVKNFTTREEAAKFGHKISGIPKYNNNKFEIGSYTNNIDVFQIHWQEYPEITEKILLNLICYLSRYSFELVPKYACFKNIQELKEYVLKCAMRFNQPNCIAKFYTEDIQKILQGKNHDDIPLKTILV